MGKFIDRLNALIVEDAETQRFMRDALLKFGVPYSSADKPQQIAFKFLMLKNDILSKETALDKMPLSKAKPLAEQKLVNALKSKGVSFPSEKVVGFNGSAILNAIDSDCEIKGFSFKNALKSVGKNLKVATLTPVYMAKIATGKASAQEKKDFYGHHRAATGVAAKTGIPILTQAGQVASYGWRKGEAAADKQLEEERIASIQKMQENRKAEFSDEALLFYMQNNPDVGKAAQSSPNPMQFAYDHWKNNGVKEGRQGTPVQFETMKSALQNNEAAQSKIEQAQKLPVMAASSGKWLAIILAGVIITVLFKKFIKK